MSELPSPDWPNHVEAWRQWRNAMAGMRMHHGWLLAGKAGVGKKDFAFCAARELVAIGAAGTVAGAHPDILELTYGPKDKKAEDAAAAGKDFDRARSIRVSQIRAMQARLTTRPTLGSHRVIIVNPADDLERAASNALLKSLEEPPAGTFFLLVAHRPARLLPTIRSRCRILRFPALTEDQLDRLLQQADATATPEARAAAIAASGGSFTAALQFAAQDLAPIAGLIRNLIARPDRNMELRGELASLIGPRADRARMAAVFELAQALVADAARGSEYPAHAAVLADIHAELVQLSSEAPTYNYDAGLLALELGGLLTGPAPASA
ncbi:MAG: DNA polymerase III subunit delta' [Erythrobacter sp.]|nr:DNA polymerase III subunit delta' [Erythrobacter sp.]